MRILFSNTVCMIFVFIAGVILGSTGKIAPYINPFLDAYGKYIRASLLVVAFSFL